MKCLVASVLLGSAALAAPAHAAVTLTFSQVGNSVVVDSVGSLNVSGATLFASGLQSTFIESRFGVLELGRAGPVNLYRLTGNGGFFGTGLAAEGTSNLASIIGLNADQAYLSLGTAYVSGASLSGRSTFANRTFASLGLIGGTYTYSIPNDSVTLVIPGAIPEPATWALMIAGFGMVGTALRRRSVAVRFA